MEKSAQMGANRTGIDMSPLQSKAMIEGAQGAMPSGGHGPGLQQMDSNYFRSAEAIGSVPLPGTLRGAFTSMKDKFTGKNPEVLLNKIGERLAFERSGVRIYETLINKCETARADGKLPATLDLDRLRQFCIEEGRHFTMLAEVLTDMGADPTAMTPDADVTGVASMGLMKVIQDPRTSIAQCLDAALSIELTDGGAWEVLIRLTREMGMDEVADRFQQALEEEHEHIVHVRRWYEEAVMQSAGVSTPASAGGARPH